MVERLLNAAFKVPGLAVDYKFELFVDGSYWYLVYGDIEQNNDQFSSRQIQTIDEYVRDRLTP